MAKATFDMVWLMKGRATCELPDWLAEENTEAVFKWLSIHANEIGIPECGEFIKGSADVDDGGYLHINDEGDELRLCRDGMRITLDDGAFMPTRAHAADAGLDLYSPIDVVIPAYTGVAINTGVHVEIPFGYAGFLKSKSGLNVKHDITSDGVIDSGYTGSIVVKLYNNGENDYKVSAGDKITQLVLVKIMLPELKVEKDLPNTERGDGGFGSTGKS